MGDAGAEMWLGGSIVLNECPITYVSGESKHFINLFWDCHNAISGYSKTDIVCHSLPDQGGVLDQDNKTMSAFNIILSEMSSFYEEQAIQASKRK